MVFGMKLELRFEPLDFWTLTFGLWINVLCRAYSSVDDEMRMDDRLWTKQSDEGTKELST